MLRWVLEQSKVRKARKAACAAISPMVARSRRRLGDIPSTAWSDPYIVGFMVMLITIAAKIEIGKIEGQTLCLVQAKAWEEITNIRPNPIGEEILLLNAARNRDFEIGCQNAMTFGSMLIGNSIMNAGADRGWHDRHHDFHDINADVIWSDRDDVAALWERFFDEHVSEHTFDNTMGLGQIAS